MAPKAQPPAKTANVRKPGTGDIIVNQIQVRSADRTKKSIQGWRTAHKSAEAIGSYNRTRLYDLYDDISIDGHLLGISAKRLDAVCNKTVSFQDRAGKKVDEMDALIQSTQFRKIMRTIMETQLWGISGLEFIPGKELAFKEVPRKHIKPELGILTVEQNSIEGISYSKLPFIWIMGEKTDLGLLLACAPYAIYKRDSMADWANYIEVFGQPVRVIKYDAYDKQTKIELKEILDESGTSLALMIPRQADFELKDGKQSNGDGKLQENFKDSLNQEMSIIILGNTETTTNGKTGTGAKSEEHGRQQDEISKSDIIYTTNYLNSNEFLAILKSYGYPVDGGRFVIQKDIDIKYLKERIAIDKEVAALAPIGHDYFYQTYGIPKPENYDELVKEKQEATKKANRKPGTTDQGDEQDDLSFTQKAKRFLSFFA